jgi:hypothetical protein
MMNNATTKLSFSSAEEQARKKGAQNPLKMEGKKKQKPTKKNKNRDCNAPKASKCK